MSRNLIDGQSYEFIPERDGTFTPNITMGSGSYVNVKQLGDVVYVQGFIALDSGTLGDISGAIGVITGVDGPSAFRLVPAMTFDGNRDYHSGILGVAKVLGNIEIYGGSLIATDKAIVMDFFYTA